MPLSGDNYPRVSSGRPVPSGSYHRSYPNHYHTPQQPSADPDPTDSSATAPKNATTLTVSREGGNHSSPLLYGIMFEEMDHSGDGGIHGQLLQNNGFQGSTLGLTAYKPIGDVDISNDTVFPVSKAITSSLTVQVPDGETKYVGFANTGYKGVPVVNATYQSEFWMLGDYSGTIILQLVGSESGVVYASHNLTVENTRVDFTRYETKFNSTASPDGNNEWRLLFDGSKVAGSWLNFGLIQLFPPTYHSRQNGLRDDLARTVEEINPSFLRFPGGNNLEGLQISSRWIWNQTIGPVVDRPGRDSDWWYPNTDALGLDEYLWWCEDAGMTPILAVWDGKSYGGIVSGPDLQPYLDDILDELEYLLGPPNSTYGKLRAQNGREDPWQIGYIEIGNEDDLSDGCDTYPDRFMQIYNTIHDQYPNVTIIVSTIDESCLPDTIPPDIIYDYHYYRMPDDLVAMFNIWDNQPRSQPVIVGEYGCRNTSEADGVFWSFMQTSCSEAVHMIGLERNSDVVKMAAYAPLLQHIGYTQWSPTLIGFDSSPESITRSTSFYVQKMFSTNRGTTILPVNSTSDFGPLYWGASRTNSTYYVKLANYGENNQTVQVNVPDTKSGMLEMLSGPKEAYNTVHNITIEPTVDNITSSDGSYSVEMAPWSVAVLVVS
ncbi:alpha-N-arabinofuranosidase A [Aspergillus alliaceus]|uniref:alpha-N-arabinofuranosidase A n=1 Tax=Petromyces alliaceus TaxID=209559 RepID=UPI0012A4350E|nr:alpha-N-arabinofuranosidase A [Aspergillus alliaceus]KAB8231258.1 alpha-N-arabinofuranosidase A [Aspergillus alliaceus]